MVSNHHDKRAVGIFDSGVGGLTVARAVRERLPGENIIYFGDSAHLPYGNKSAQTVTHYSINNCNFLLSHNVKMIIAACNTASAVALKDLKRRFNVPIAGVIEPGAIDAAEGFSGKTVTIIGTIRTIKTGAYREAVEKIMPYAKIVEKACPLLVPLIEHPLPQKKVLHETLKEYLSDIMAKTDTLILGCTHYPLIKNDIKVLWPNVRIVDSAEATARYVEKVLEEKGLFNRVANDSNAGKTLVFTNDLNENFSELAAEIFDKKSCTIKEIPV